MSDIICKIVAGEIPCAKVYENEDVIAFKDINPMGADPHPGHAESACAGGRVRSHAGQFGDHREVL